MRHTIYAGLLTLIAFACTTSESQAQRLEFKPIDTNALIVQPIDTATNIVGGTFRYVSRAVANTLDADGFVRTVNSLLGREPQRAGVQPGFSPLPLAGSYPSTNYPNSFRPEMPRYQQFGQSLGR